MTAISLGPSPSRRDLLPRRVRLLTAATITWNAAEAAVALRVKGCCAPAVGLASADTGEQDVCRMRTRLRFL